jgi:hypothetical protein
MGEHKLHAFVDGEELPEQPSHDFAVVDIRLLCEHEQQPVSGSLDVGLARHSLGVSPW